MVARVTAGLAESNGSLPPGLTYVTCRLTAKNRDQLRNPTLSNRVWATFTFLTALMGKVMRPVVSVCLSALLYSIADLDFFAVVYIVAIARWVMKVKVKSRSMRRTMSTD